MLTIVLLATTATVDTGSGLRAARNGQNFLPTLSLSPCLPMSGCTKAFSQLSNLQSHSRCHQTDKPHKCQSCYKCFADEAALLEHIPKHKESKHVKTHICAYCGKSYTQVNIRNPAFISLSFHFLQINSPSQKGRSLCFCGGGVSKQTD